MDDFIVDLQKVEIATDSDVTESVTPAIWPTQISKVDDFIVDLQKVEIATDSDVTESVTPAIWPTQISKVDDFMVDLQNVEMATDSDVTESVTPKSWPTQKSKLDDFMVYPQNVEKATDSDVTEYYNSMQLSYLYHLLRRRMFWFYQLMSKNRRLKLLEKRRGTSGYSFVINFWREPRGTSRYSNYTFI